MSCHRGADAGLDCCIRVLISVSFSTSVCGASRGCANGLGQHDLHVNRSQSHRFKTFQDKGWWSVFHSPLNGGRESFLSEITSLFLSPFKLLGLYIIVTDNLSGSTFSDIISFWKCSWGKKISTNPIKIKLIQYSAACGAPLRMDLSIRWHWLRLKYLSWTQSMMYNDLLTFPLALLWNI